MPCRIRTHDLSFQPVKAYSSDRKITVPGKQVQPKYPLQAGRRLHDLLNLVTSDGDPSQQEFELHSGIDKSL
jgi:hypothetical protein